MNTTTVGVDLAKTIFAVCVMDGQGRVLRHLQLRREALAAWLAQVPAGTVVAMEACSGAHHWASLCVERTAAAADCCAVRDAVSPEPERKNDRNDAEAIATAAPGQHAFCAVKTVDQQARLSWHRVREGYKAENLEVMSRMRGLLAEFGIVIAKSQTALRRALADLAEQEDLPGEFVELLGRACASTAKDPGAAARVRSAHGGPMPRATNGACACRRSPVSVRSPPMRWSPLSATTGFQARPAAGGMGRTGADAGFQWRTSTTRAHQLSRRGYLRTLLIQGARSSVKQAHRVTSEKATPEQIWIRQLAARLSVRQSVWWPSPTNMLASYGPCSLGARLTILTPGLITR